KTVTLPQSARIKLLFPQDECKWKFIGMCSESYVGLLRGENTWVVIGGDIVLDLVTVQDRSIDINYVTMTLDAEEHIITFQCCLLCGVNLIKRIKNRRYSVGDGYDDPNIPGYQRIVSEKEDLKSIIKEAAEKVGRKCEWTNRDGNDYVHITFENSKWFISYMD